MTLYLTTKQAAELIGIKPRTLTKWMREQKPGLPKPSEISPRHFLWDAGELEEFVRRNKHDVKQDHSAIATTDSG